MSLSRVIAASLLVASAGARAEPVAGRGAVVQHLEQVEGRDFRFVVTVFEEDGALRYPITTLDRAHVKIVYPGTEITDSAATSLALYDSAAAGVKRALIVAFHPGDRKDAGEVKTEVADLLGRLSSPYLAVGLVGDGAETLLADVTPGRSENVTRLQQDILALGAEDSMPDLASTWCFAAERLRGWDLAGFGPGDQKIVVAVGPDDTSADGGAKGECLAELKAVGARVYRIGWGAPRKRTADLGAVLVGTGGFEHRVRGGADVHPALSNIVALLKHEYVVEFRVPDGVLPQQPLRVQPTFTYHGDVFTATTRALPVVLENPPPPEPAKAPEVVVEAPKTKRTVDPRAYAGAAVGAVMMVVGGALAFRRLRQRARTTACNSCARRVEKNHKDCPFRKPQVFGRLVVLAGPNAGQTLPLFKGENKIGSAGNAGVHVRGRKVRRRHATLTLDGTKALYAPAGLGDRVDGWPVTEPRLLGIGSVLHIGDQKLRFEARRDAARAALDEAA